MAGDCLDVLDAHSSSEEGHGHSCCCVACSQRGHVLREDATGAYYMDFASAEVTGTAQSALAAEDYADLLPIRVDDVPVYHSQPSAKQKIYLDFNGHRVFGTGWNEHNGGRTIDAPAFDRDGDDSTFSGLEQRAIELIWSRVAEDFAPFEIDVTTESPSPRDFSAGNQAIRVLISTNVDQLSGKRWFQNVGGVGYVGSWKLESDTPVWAFSNILNGNEKRIAEAVSHELGHAFGLDHDGTDVDEYFSGFDKGDVSWAPIMGSGSGRALTQWSRGEYHEASNSENDFSIIASKANEIEFREDDHSSTFFSPTELKLDEYGAFHEDGVISTSVDTDIFSFEMESGRLQLDVSVTEFGSNLDAQLTLYDGDVRILGTFNPHNDLSAGVDAELPAGKYFVRVDGVGRGDPTSDGYSEYGSVGTYVIEGSFPKADKSMEPTNKAGPFGFADFLLMAELYGRSVPSSHPIDLDLDGRVNFSDFLILGQNYGV